jgi:hypothetical protein
MTSPPDLLRFGYWPLRQMSGDIPPAIRSPDAYTGGDVLNIACTQTGLPAKEQQRLVEAWTRCLPDVQATTVVFSSKVSQPLFDAACRAPNLHALNLKWSACTSLAALTHARRLTALWIGSSPAIADLGPLAQLSELRHLFLENVGAPVDISFVRHLVALQEFGLSAARGHRMSVLTLEPLSALPLLKMLWLVSLQIQQGGLEPLHGLKSLVSLRTTIKPNTTAFKDLRAAVPALEFFQPVG